MADKIILLDGSRRLHKDISLEAIAEIARLRKLEIEYQECPEFLQTFVDIGYEPSRKQVNAERFTQALHMTDEMKSRYEAGKVIIVDNDIYSGDRDCNFFFGGFSQAPGSLGYITLSTARVSTMPQARDLIRHELGHMFGAPSEERANTEQSLGLHCLNHLCVMQQKLTLAEAVRYAEQRARMNAGTYCGQCEQDIQDFRVPE